MTFVAVLMTVAAAGASAISARVLLPPCIAIWAITDGRRAKSAEEWWSAAAAISTGALYVERDSSGSHRVFTARRRTSPPAGW